MLSLLNKSAADKASAQTVPWRPDFRNVSQLPDTKTVRTGFFVNLVAISIAGALGLYVAQREWEVAGLRSDLENVETRISEAKPESDKAQATYKLFQAEEKKFTEAYALVRDPFRFPDFLVHLGSLQPSAISLRRVDFRGLAQNVLVSASISGLDAAASDQASAYVKLLQSDAKLAEHFRAIEMSSIGRNVEGNSLNLELVFTFKSNEPKAAKGAKGAAKKK